MANELNELDGPMRSAVRDHNLPRDTEMVPRPPPGDPCWRGFGGAKPRQQGPLPRVRRSPAAEAAASILTAVPEEAALVIACALASAQDLVHLAIACRRFVTKCIAAPLPAPPRTAASGGAAATEAAEMWSIVEEAGRRWIAGCTDQERGWVPRRGRESWLGLMWEVEVLRRAAAHHGSWREFRLYG